MALVSVIEEALRSNACKKALKKVKKIIIFYIYGRFYLPRRVVLTLIVRLALCSDSENATTYT